jgi:hypothetical protein
MYLNRRAKRKALRMAKIKSFSIIWSSPFWFWVIRLRLRRGQETEDLSPFRLQLAQFGEADVQRRL